MNSLSVAQDSVSVGKHGSNLISISLSYPLIKPLPPIFICSVFKHLSLASGKKLTSFSSSSTFMKCFFMSHRTNSYIESLPTFKLNLPYYSGKAIGYKASNLVSFSKKPNMTSMLFSAKF